MNDLLRYRRIVLLAEESFGVFTSKTAVSLLRYRPDDVAAVLDASHAGRTTAQIVPGLPSRPIIASFADADELHPDAVFVCVHPSGGALPGALRRHLCDALDRGLDIVSGLHTRLVEDDELATRAAQHGAALHDIRVAPAERVIGSGRARQTRARRVLLVGTDGNVGKMVAALELTRAAQQRGLNAAFVATGQTGMMISGHGVAVDAIISDFAAGAIEQAVCEVGDCDILFVEGQGGFGHPGFSPVTLATLHGACPDALVLAHHAGRTHHRTQPAQPLPNLRALCDAYLATAALVHRTRFAGAALNCTAAGEIEIERDRARLAQVLLGPVVDPLHDPLDPLLDACLAQ